MHDDCAYRCTERAFSLLAGCDLAAGRGRLWHEKCWHLGLETRRTVGELKIVPSWLAVPTERSVASPCNKIMQEARRPGLRIFELALHACTPACCAAAKSVRACRRNALKRGLTICSPSSASGCLLKVTRAPLLSSVQQHRNRGEAIPQCTAVCRLSTRGHTPSSTAITFLRSRHCRRHCRQR